MERHLPPACADSAVVVDVRVEAGAGLGPDDVDDEDIRCLTCPIDAEVRFAGVETHVQHAVLGAARQSDASAPEDAVQENVRSSALVLVL